MVAPEIDACPNCGNTDVYCYSNGLGIIGNDVEKHCSACVETFDLEAAVYG